MCRESSERRRSGKDIARKDVQGDRNDDGTSHGRYLDKTPGIGSWKHSVHLEETKEREYGGCCVERSETTPEDSSSSQPFESSSRTELESVVLPNRER